MKYLLLLTSLLTPSIWGTASSLINCNTVDKFNNGAVDNKATAPAKPSAAFQEEKSSSNQDNNIYPNPNSQNITSILPSRDITKLCDVKLKHAEDLKYIASSFPNLHTLKIKEITDSLIEKQVQPVDLFLSFLKHLELTHPLSNSDAEFLSAKNMNKLLSISPSLQHLKLSGIQSPWQSLLIDKLSNLTNLQIYNPLSTLEDLESLLRNLPSLKSLQLNYNKVDWNNLSPGIIKNLEKLQYLHIKEKDIPQHVRDKLRKNLPKVKIGIIDWKYIHRQEREQSTEKLFQVKLLEQLKNRKVFRNSVRRRIKSLRDRNTCSSNQIT